MGINNSVCHREPTKDELEQLDTFIKNTHVQSIVKRMHEAVYGTRSQLFGYDVETLSIRLAALSGATAVMASAYGTHKVLMDPKIDAKRKKALKNGNRFHFIHTLALLGASRAPKPALTMALFTGGILLFCVPCYAFALENNEKARKVTPIGGVLLVLGWLSFLL